MGRHVTRASHEPDWGADCETRTRALTRRSPPVFATMSTTSPRSSGRIVQSTSSEPSTLALVTGTRVPRGRRGESTMRPERRTGPSPEATGETHSEAPEGPRILSPDEFVSFWGKAYDAVLPYARQILIAAGATVGALIIAWGVSTWRVGARSFCPFMSSTDFTGLSAV